MVKKPRVLIVDIETAPALVWTWGMYNQNHSVDQVKEHPYILCIGAQWLGDKEVITYSKWEHGTVPMLLNLHELFTQADLVIGKNSTKFDLPWIRMEMLKHLGMPFPPLTHVDLEKVARGKFRFLSNKLEYILQYLEMGGKMKHDGFDMWVEVMDGNKKAQAAMLKYCAQDVRQTGKLYERMRPFIEDHPAFRAIGTEACQKCGSHHVQKRGKRHTACYEIQRYECQKCGGWFQGQRKKVA